MNLGGGDWMNRSWPCWASSTFESAIDCCTTELYSRWVHIDVLAVPDCPNLPDALTRVDTALATLGITDAVVCTRLAVELAEAEALGMRGSPTILIDGRDPFAIEDAPASISCRLYRSTTGMSGCPTVDEIVVALNATAS
jgi:hypothetical protein